MEYLKLKDVKKFTVNELINELLLIDNKDKKIKLLFEGMINENIGIKENKDCILIGIYEG